MRESFVRSINSVAAKLAMEIGLEKIISRAHQMGITSEIPKLPSISLGSAEVSLIELVTTYTVIANGGYKIEPYVISKIFDSYDNELYIHENYPKKIMDDLLVKQMDNLLRGVVVWGTGKAANVNDMEIRGKTGTSQDYRDAWFIGFTGDLVIGVWIGNDEE